MKFQIFRRRNIISVCGDKHEYQSIVNFLTKRMVAYFWELFQIGLKKKCRLLRIIPVIPKNVDKWNRRRNGCYWTMVDLWSSYSKHLYCPKERRVLVLRFNACMWHQFVGDRLPRKAMGTAKVTMSNNRVAEYNS